MKKSIRNLGFLCLFCPIIGLAQTAPNLQELVDGAIENSEQLKQQHYQIQLTQLDDQRLEDVFLPKVNLSGKAGYLYTSAGFKTPGIDIPEVEDIGFQGLHLGDRKQNIRISGWSFMTKVEADMLIYSGGKVQHLKEANKEKALSQERLMEKTTDDLITEVSRAYDQFALLNASYRALLAGKDRLDINRKTADKALSYGLITPYDHQKIELAQATLDSKIVEYEGKRYLLITLLHLLTGIEEDRIALIETDLTPIHYLVGDAAIEERAEIQALDHGILAAEHKINAEKKWWIPKVAVQSSLSYVGLYGGKITSSREIVEGTGYKLNIKPSDLNILPIFQAGLWFKWDLFDGNEGKSMVEEAKINQQILVSQREDAKKKLKLNLVNNQTNYDIANAQIELKAKAVEIAEKALVNVEKEFRYGTKTSADLIEAENDLINAELEYQTAIFNQRRSAVELMKSTQDLKIERL